MPKLRSVIYFHSGQTVSDLLSFGANSGDLHSFGANGGDLQLFLLNNFSEILRMKSMDEIYRIIIKNYEIYRGQIKKFN